MLAAWRKSGLRGAGICSAILLTLTAAGARGLLVADDLPEEYRLAVGYYNKENWKAAAEHFRAFLKNNAGHAKVENARYYYGLTLVKLDDLKTARETLRSFLKDYPQARDAGTARYWVGHCSYHLDDFAAATAEFEAFLQKSPDDALAEWALPYLGDALLRQKKAQPALEFFQQALDKYPQGALAEDARFGVARAQEALGNLPEALKGYRTVAADRTGARAAEAQLAAGAVLFEQGDFRGAAAAYEVLEKQFPESPQVPLAQLNHGFARYQMGEYRQALAQFEKSGKIAKYAAESALWKGLSLKGAGDLGQAVALLKTAYEAHRDHPAAERILFQWADCEQRRENFDRARELFLEVLSRWPKGSWADESLYAAALAAVNAAKLSEAEALLARFDRDFPKNRLRFRAEILKGRVKAAQNDLPGAIALFRAVISGSELESTQQQARYYLGDAYQKLGQHAEALEATEPLATRLDAEKGAGDLAGVRVLRAVSQLALARAAESRDAPSAETLALCAAAADSATRYLDGAPAGPFAPQARAVLVLAAARRGDADQALAALEKLRTQFPKSAEFEQAQFELASLAYDHKDWALAEKLFGELAARPKDARLRPRALADLGWTQHQRKKHLEAAATFAKLLADYPADELAAEAAFMHGKSLQEAGRLPDAQAAFDAAFRRPGEGDHAFLAGLQAARLLVRLKKVPEADAAYTRLLERFRNHKESDKVVDEWALVHYQAEDFAKADELFRRLAADYPDSPLADDARLSLAESAFLAGKTDDARAQFAALSADPRSDESVQQRALYQRLQIEVSAKRWDELRKVCSEALARFPEGNYRWDAEFRWAEADFQQGAFKPALERLLAIKAGRLKVAEPAGEGVRPPAWLPQVWVLLAETHLRLKDYDAVAADVAEFREWDARSPFLYQAESVLGRSLKQRPEPKFAEARAAFERVIRDEHAKDTETAASSQFYIAEIFLFEKNYEAALREYERVDITYKFPEWQAKALLQEGACHEALGQWKSAVRSYDELLRRFPQDEFAPKARERLEGARKKAAG